MITHPQSFFIHISGDLTPNPEQSTTLSSPTKLPDFKEFRGYPRTTAMLGSVRSPAYYRGLPGGKPRKAHLVSRAWESVSAGKAKAFYPELDPGFLENKFRWGAFKAFAYTRGGPVKEISHPVAAVNGMTWLIERNFVKRADGGMLVLRKKGSDLYNILFKDRSPRNFTP